MAATPVAILAIPSDQPPEFLRFHHLDDLKSAIDLQVLPINPRSSFVPTRRMDGRPS